MSDAAASAATSGPMAGAVAPAEAPRARMSDMGHAGNQPKLAPLPPPQAPANQQQVVAQQPLAAEPEPQEAQLPEAEPQAEAEPQEGVLTPEEAHAKYLELMNSPDLDTEAFADKTIWLTDRNGNQMPVKVGDLDKHAMLYGDYQFKTRELAEKTRAVDQKEGTWNAFHRDVVSGDPATTLRALRWAGVEKAFEKAIVLPYVQRMVELEGLPPAVRERMLSAEAAEDRAVMLERELQTRRQREQQLAEMQSQEQGINAPDIQHVTNHIGQRLPEIAKTMGVTDSPAFQRELGEVLIQATNGERGQDGRWIVAPTLQRGRTPTDETLRQLVGAAQERVNLLIAQAQGRQPTRRQQLPPPPAATAVTGPAARPGQRGNISAPERMRYSDIANHLTKRR